MGPQRVSLVSVLRLFETRPSQGVCAVAPRVCEFGPCNIPETLLHMALHYAFFCLRSFLCLNQVILLISKGASHKQ